MPAPLPVGKIVLGAFLVPWWHRAAFARALAVPLALLVLFSLAWYSIDELLTESWRWLLWLLYLGYLALFTLFAVTTHRLVLLDASAVATRFASRARRESRFFGFAVLMALIYMGVQYASLLLMISLPGVSHGVLQDWVGWMKQFATIPALYVLARLAPIFQATAIDRRADLSGPGK